VNGTPKERSGQSNKIVAPRSLEDAVHGSHHWKSRSPLGGRGKLQIVPRWRATRNSTCLVRRIIGNWPTT